MKRALSAFIFIAALFGIWQWLVSSEIVPSFILPSPNDVLAYLASAISDASITNALLVTLKRLVIGYSVSLAIGIPFGFLAAKFNFISDTLGLLAISAQALPSVCWVPFALLCFGQGEGAMLFVVVMGSFGSILLAAETSVRRVPKNLIEAARTMGSRRFHTVFAVLFPAALPELFSGMKQGWAFAWRSLMAAEIYVTVIGGFGLGQLLHYGRELHAMDQVIGVMFVILAIGLSLEQLVFAPIQRNLQLQRGN